MGNSKGASEWVPEVGIGKRFCKWSQLLNQALGTLFTKMVSLIQM